MLKPLLSALAITIGLQLPTIAAPIYPSAENPMANAWIFEPPTNCRSGPSMNASVEHEFTKSAPISVDVRTAVPGPVLGRFGDRRWFFEYSKSCWIHESRIFWMEDGDKWLHKVLPTDRQ